LARLEIKKGTEKSEGV